MDSQSPVFRSLDIIEKRILEKLTVADIAGSVHFSKYHYQRIFREIVGESVMGYVTKRKLTMASSQLLTTDATILDVALMFGYDSHEGFTRSFKAYMGITPMQFRKHGLSTISLKNLKERCVMLYSKTTDGIIRELNDLIVKTKEVGELARKLKGADADYAGFWELMADNSDEMADELRAHLARIANIAHQADEISSRFAIIKAIESISFKSNLAAFNAGVMASKAAVNDFEPIVDKYYELAGFAHAKVGRISELFNELAGLIFDDMRNNARRLLQDAAKMGESAAAALAAHPHSYIADEISSIASELSSAPLSDIAVWHLENCLFRLHQIHLAASTETSGIPAHKGLSDITAFQDGIAKVIDFFLNLPTDATQSTMTANYSDFALQGHLLLFAIRGEVQKNGETRLFGTVFDRMSKVIALAQVAKDESVLAEMAVLANEAHDEMITQADKLGLQGAAIKFIAKEIKLYALRASARAV